MRIPKNGPLSILLFALGFGAMIYEAVNYIGIHRLATELQLSLLGFSLNAVSMAASAVYLIPGALVAPDWDARRNAYETSFDTYEGMALHRQSRWARRLIRRWLPLAAAATIAMFVYDRSQPAAGLASRPIPVDVAAVGTAGPPLGVPVALEGVPDRRALVVLRERGYNVFRDEATVALYPGKEGTPYRFFVYLGDDGAKNERALYDFERSRSIRGTLSEGGVNGRTRAEYERVGISIAEPHYLLHRDDGTGPGNPFARTMMLGIATAILLLLWLNCLRLIRKYRRELAEMTE